MTLRDKLAHSTITNLEIIFSSDEMGWWFALGDAMNIEDAEDAVVSTQNLVERFVDRLIGHADTYFEDNNKIKNIIKT